MTISMQATDVRARTRQGIVGMPIMMGVLVAALTMINSDPQAAQVDTVTVDTATNDHEYTLDINGIEISYTADSSATKIEVAAGIAAAIEAEPAVRGQVTAESDGVDKVTLTGLTPGQAFTVTDVDALLTHASVTTAAEASSVPFGRAVLFNGFHTDGDGTRLGKIAQASAFTAQVRTLTVTYAAGAKYTVIVKNKATGEIWASIVVDADTDDNTTATAINTALGQALPANTVGNGVATNVVTLTAEIAGIEFTAEGSVDTATAALVFADSVAPSASTSLDRAIAGISTYGRTEEAPSVAATTGEYPPNLGMVVQHKGPIWVDRPEAVSKGDLVYVELAAGSNAGKLYKTASTTRVQLDPAKAIWERDGRDTADAIAGVRLNIEL